MKLITRFSALAAVVLVFGCGDEFAPPTTGSIALDIRIDQTAVLSRVDTGSVADTSFNGSAELEGESEAGPRLAVAAFTSARATTIGPTAKSVDLTLVDGFWEGELTALQPGDYQVLVEGRVDGEIDHLGLAAGVTVVAGSQASSSVTLVSFRPTIAVGLSSPTRLLTIPLTIGTVAAAETYRVEWARNPEFTGASRGDFEGPALEFTAVDTATYYFRARAVIGTVVGRASDAASITILGDAATTGDDAASALLLGFGVGNINQTIGDLNIAPSSDEDWFGLDACQEDTLIVETFAERLNPPSELDTYLRLFDSNDGLIDENDDDTGTDSYLETVLAFDDTYYVQVSSFNGASAGHYEIAFELRPGPYNLGTACAPGPATAVVTPDTTLTAIDDQAQMTVQVFNQGGGLLNPGDYILTWDTDAPGVATVSPSGLVTAIGNGTATISVDAIRSAPAGDAIAAGPATGFATVTVQQVADWVEVSPSGATVSGLGSGQSFSAEAFDANGNPIASPSVSWFDYNADVATVDASGNASAQRDGQATIGAVVDGVWGHALLTVENPSTTPVNVWGREFVPITGPTFRGVWGLADDDVYAVGGSPFEIFHWDGANWNPVSHAFDGVFGTFYGVWGSAADDIFVVGDGPAIVHYDGFSWDSMPVPPTAASFFGGVWGSGPDDVFATGINTLGVAAVFHYDGGSWTEMTTPATGPQMYQVWGFAWDDVYTVSWDGEFLHYDGFNWNLISSPSANLLLGVRGTTPSDLFVTGIPDTIFRWDGGSWTEYPVPGGVGFHAYPYGASSSDMYFPGNASVTRFDGSTLDVMDPAPSWLWQAWGTGEGAVFMTGTAQTLLRGVRGGSVSITAGPDTLWSPVLTQYLAQGFDAAMNPLDTVAFIWESRDAGVLTVDQAGVARAQGYGTTWLVATAPGGAADSMEVTSFNARPPGDIVIYKNYNSFGGGSVAPIESTLVAAPFNFTKNTDYFVSTRAGLATGIPSSTSLIILNSAGAGDNLGQVSEVNDANAVANMDAWVQAGGWLVAHLADNFAGGYIIPGLSGIADDITNCQGLSLAVASRALIRGPDRLLGTADDLTDLNIDSQGGCQEVHGSLAGILPAGADTIIMEAVEATLGLGVRPVYASYRWGLGRVIVTTQTIELAVPWSTIHANQVLVNHLFWVVNGMARAAPPPATPEPRQSGRESAFIRTRN